jgi:hypothetical protein
MGNGSKKNEIGSPLFLISINIQAYLLLIFVAGKS